MWLIIIDDASGSCGPMGSGEHSESTPLGYFVFKKKSIVLRFLNQQMSKDFKKAILEATEAKDDFFMKNPRFKKIKNIFGGEYISGYGYGHRPRRNFRILKAVEII